MTAEGAVRVALRRAVPNTPDDLLDRVARQITGYLDTDGWLVDDDEHDRRVADRAELEQLRAHIRAEDGDVSAVQDVAARALEIETALRRLLAATDPVEAHAAIAAAEQTLAKGHGTARCYWTGCRRPECRAAHAAYERARKASSRRGRRADHPVKAVA